MSSPIEILTSGSSFRDRALLGAAIRGAGAFSGSSLTVEFRPGLRGTSRGNLAESGRGFPVHGASDIPRRTILLNATLRQCPLDAQRILLHEVFHFVWVRLGNPARWAWEEVLREEIRSNATGELGGSAEHQKSALATSDVQRRSRRWRNYCAESFCDSAAWVFGGTPAHDEVTLGRRWRGRRRAWLVRQSRQGSFRV